MNTAIANNYGTYSVTIYRTGTHAKLFSKGKKK